MIVDDAHCDAFAQRLSFLEAMGTLILAEDFDGFGFDMPSLIARHGACHGLRGSSAIRGRP